MLLDWGVTPSRSADAHVNIQQIARNRCRKLIREFLFTITWNIATGLPLSYTVDSVFGVTWNESLNLCWNSDKDLFQSLTRSKLRGNISRRKYLLILVTLAPGVQCGGLLGDCHLVVVGGLGYQVAATDLGSEAEGYCPPHDALQFTDSPVRPPVVLHPHPHPWPHILPQVQCLTPEKCLALKTTNNSFSLSHLISSIFLILALCLRLVNTRAAVAVPRTMMMTPTNTLVPAL